MSICGQYDLIFCQVWCKGLGQLPELLGASLQDFHAVNSAMQKRELVRRAEEKIILETFSYASVLVTTHLFFQCILTKSVSDMLF